MNGPHREAAAGVFLASLLLAACAPVPNDPVPAAPVPADGPGPVADCLPPLVLDEETTVAAIGLADDIEGVGADATRRGAIKITRDTVAWEDFAPPGVPAPVAEGQLLCITWPDGSGMTTMLQVHFSGPEVAPAAGQESAPPWTALALLAGVVVVVGISWLAFRRPA